MSMTIQPQQGLTITPAKAGTAKAPAGEAPARTVSAETLEMPKLEALHAELVSEPELRPSEVARALVWAKDPNYPPLDALNNIASMFLASAIRHL